MPKASLDPPDPKDPEKVDVGLKMKMAAEEEEVVVDVRKASLIMRTLVRPLLPLLFSRSIKPFNFSFFATKYRSLTCK